MLKRTCRLPSPALVISLITLSLVLGGTAIAASTAKHADAKADKKLIKKTAPTLSVKHAKTANSANTAANATHATSADSATNATNATNATHATNADHATSADNGLLAFGSFAADGSVLASSTPFNLTAANVTHPLTGVYCLTGLSFTPRTGMVAGNNAFGANDTMATIDVTNAPLTDCAAGDMVRIRTQDHTGALVNRPFIVWLS